MTEKTQPFFSLALEYPHTGMFIKAGETITNDLESDDMEVAGDSDENMDGSEKETEDTGPAWDAKEMMREIKGRWSETAALVSVPLLERLYQGIKDASLFINMDELQPILNCASYLDSDDVPPADTAKSILALVRKARCNVVVIHNRCSR
jgi:hypothetical protein